MQDKDADGIAASSPESSHARLLRRDPQFSFTGWGARDPYGMHGGRRPRTAVGDQGKPCPRQMRTFSVQDCGA